jgi:hypothetical protein
MCSLRYIRRIPRCALQMPLKKHGTAAGGLQALPRIITRAETQRRRSPIASARENDHAGIAATQCVTSRALEPSIRWRQNAVCLIACRNRSPTAGENHPKSYGIPMEYLWSTYGIPMEFVWNSALATPYPHATITLATRTGRAHARCAIPGSQAHWHTFPHVSPAQRQWPAINPRLSGSAQPTPGREPASLSWRARGCG